MTNEKKFDANFYLKKYPDVQMSGLDPFEHYEKYGKLLGRVFYNSSDESVKKGALGAPFANLKPCYKDLLKISFKRKNGLALDATILRTRSIKAREILAWMASYGNSSCEQIYFFTELSRIHGKKSESYSFLNSLDESWLLKLAKVLALQSTCPSDRQNSYSLYNFFYETRNKDFLQEVHAKIFFDLAFFYKEYRLANEILEKLTFKSNDRFYSKVDMMNPFLIKGGSFEKWKGIKAFNHVFNYYGLEVIGVNNNQASPFDSIVCFPKRNIREGPLVSVVVSVWKPDQGLITSVNSLINQSWRNIEIIIVDDCCEDKYQPLIKYVSGLDKRVKLLRQKKNKGTYMARNLAMLHANGKYVTFQDADDWSHPRRIELQVKALVEDKGLIANTSKTVRTTDYLSFSYLGYANPKRLNTSSLMFDLERTKNKLGYFDASRKGADSEYLTRIEVVFGKNAYKELREVLSIVRLSMGSLSRSEFGPGWHHPSRVLYKGAYKLWHQKIKDGQEEPYLSHNGESRKFPVPFRFQVDKVKGDFYDVIMVGDWRKIGGPQNSMIQEIKALKKAGYKVAVAHLEAYRFMTTEMQLMNHKIQELINEGVVDAISYDDNVTARKILLRYPPILQFLPEAKSNIQAHELIVVANQAPQELDGSDVRYEVDACIRNAKEFFGLDTKWMPQGPLVRDSLQDLVPKELLVCDDLLGIINSDDWLSERRKLSGPKPIIGRYSRDDLMKFPETKKELLLAYPDSLNVDILIMGGKSSCKKILEGAPFPKNWKILDNNELTPRDFLNSVDFFVHFDNSKIVEAFGRSILESIASGTVTILPKKFKRVFGDAAYYCNLEDIEETVSMFYANPSLYDEQSRKGIDVVRERFSEQAFINKIHSL